MSTPYPGTEALVDLVNRAVEQTSVSEITDELTRNLCGLIRSGAVQLPTELTQPHPSRYARRLVHQDEARGYSIIAMTWGPDQGTPIHDHGGLWCVEGVCEGRIEVEQYDLVEEEGDSCCFIKQGLVEAGVGSAGCLIPPYEYHAIKNGCSERPAVSVHIYGGDMTACCVFEPTDDGRFRRETKRLSLDG